MGFSPQQIKEVVDGYVVSVDDHDYVLECRGGTIVLPQGLPRGFYCTIVMIGDTDVVIDPQFSNLHTATGASTLTAIWQSVVIYSRAPNDYVGLGMP